MPFTTQKFNLNIEQNTEGYINSSDEKFLDQINKIADEIHRHRDEKPIILLSGPSGSGKTTTALTLEKVLDEGGFSTHTLSLDNYFLPITKKDQLLLAKGELDLESPKRVDTKFLNTQLNEMINCERVDLPKYNFKYSIREFGRSLKRKPGEMIILEGIHALNPEVITIPDENTVKIYVSVRTRVSDGQITLHPAKIRLLRRMIRDRIYRNRSISETIKMFESVELGEKKYIMPYKYRSTFDIDTFIPYEIGAYKPYLLNELVALEDKEIISDLIEILERTDEVQECKVPRRSLIREFIGNGQFQY